MGSPFWYHGDGAIAPSLSQADFDLLNQIVQVPPAPGAIDDRSEGAKAIRNQITTGPWMGYNFPLVAADCDCIASSGEEERDGLLEWLEGLIKFFFAPRGYSLTGEFRVSADASDDCGVLYIKDNKCEFVPNTNDNPGPSWASLPYMSDDIRDAIAKVVEFADDEGCDGDLTVTSKSAVDALAGILSKLARAEARTKATVEAPAERAPLSAADLMAEYDALAENGSWGEHPRYTMTDWQVEVGLGHTRTGYWDWVATRLEAEEAEDEK